MKFIGACQLSVKRFWFIVVVLAVCGLAAPSARAEMPPSAYLSFQRDAPEALEAEITAVQTKKSETKDAVTIRVTLEAKVLKVKRTATGLKEGATITIKYDHWASKIRGWVGPSAVPILEKGEKCPAYLKQAVGKPPIYEAAAGGYTFRAVSG